MNTISRSLLLQQRQNQPQTIPIRRNGCVCFIPVASSQQDENIKEQCIANCFRLSQQLGFNPTFEQCSECCTTCIEQGEGENCRAACVLGDPAQLNQALIASGIDNSLFATSINNIINVQFTTQINELVRQLYCAYSSVINQPGFRVTLFLVVPGVGDIRLLFFTNIGISTVTLSYVSEICNQDTLVSATGYTGGDIYFKIVIRSPTGQILQDESIRYGVFESIVRVSQNGIFCDRDFLPATQITGSISGVTC